MCVMERKALKFKMSITQFIIEILFGSFVQLKIKIDC